MRRITLFIAAAVIAGCISPGRNTPLGTIEDPISLSPERRNYGGAPVDSGTTIGTARIPARAEPLDSAPMFSAPDLETLEYEIIDPGPEMLETPEVEISPDEQGPSLSAPVDVSPDPDFEKPVQPAARPAKLFLDIRAPKTVAVGANVTYDITIRNEGGEVEDVEVFCTIEGGLEFPGKKDLKTVKRSIGRVEIDDAQTMELTLIAKKPGQQCVQFTVKSDGKEAVWKSVCLRVVEQAISVSIVGPGERTVDHRAEFTVKIANIGHEPLTGINANLYYGDELIPREATEGAEEKDGQLSWNLGDLQPGEGLQLQVEFECSRVAERAKVRAEVHAANHISLESRASLQITSLPGILDLRISDEDDPLIVGKKFFYVVEVHNQGFQSVQEMQVTVSPPAGIRLLDAKVHHLGGKGADGKRVVGHRVDGRRWEFEPVANFPSEGRLQIRIHAQAVRPGDHVLQATVKSQLATTPFVVNEPTTVLAK